MATPGPVLAALIQKNVIDTDFPHLSSTAMPFVVRTPEREESGYSPWEMPLNLEAFHWAALWDNLRRRVPDDRFHSGHAVVDADVNCADVATLCFADGSRRAFDLVIFADGYYSLGRRLVAPEIDLAYRGYILWRGLLAENELEDSSPMGGKMTRVTFSNPRGHVIFYLVPGLDGSLAPGRRLVNWAAYIPVPAADLPELMVDRAGVARAGAIPPGAMRLEAEDHLKRLLRQNLPIYYGDVLARTQNTYVQLMYTVLPPRYHRGRICVIGDAGTVTPPFTGSGVFKGYNNVLDLLAALHAAESVEDALQLWGKEQARLGARLLALAEQMEAAFIWQPFDLAGADAAATAAWWRQVVDFPEEFAYVGA